MATVYLATDVKHDRRVAIKVMRGDLAAVVGSARFLQEIRIAARLTHPNILPLHDSGEADGLLYYVMPYVAGESLRSRIDRERQLPLDEALQIAREVAEGLEYAHREGFVHRDVKPGNILLESGHAVIADFGLARALRAAAGQELTSAQLVLGTPTYMSPEQSTGGPLDGRTDIYSLGCVLYEMLVGEPPFTGPSAQVVAARHQQQAPLPIATVRSTVPAWLEETVAKALAKTPADRFQTAAALAGALGRRDSQPVAVTSSRRAAWLPAILAGGALAALAFSMSRYSGVEGDAGPSPPIAQPGPTSVAVLYFDNESQDRDMRAVANGLTEDLIDELGRVEALSVISPNGVRPYRDRHVPLDSIARTLSVGTIVTGTVSGTLASPEVTVRLVEAATGRQVDSRLIQGTEGIVALRTALVTEVARFLRVRLGQEVSLRGLRAEAPNASVWLVARRAEDLRTDARALHDVGDSVGSRRALAAADSLLGVAARSAPDWITPVVMRGWLTVDRIDLDESMGTREVLAWAARGLEYAGHALAIVPEDPRALELRGTLRFLAWYNSNSASDEDLETAERDLRAAAVSDNPSAPRAWGTLSSLLVARGSFQEAYLAARRAYQSDAFLTEAAAVVFRLYHTSLLGGRGSEAVQWCAEGYERFSDDWLFTLCRLTLLSMPDLEDPDVQKAWGLAATLENLVPPAERRVMTPRWRMMVAGVMARAGLSDSARRAIAEARRMAEDDIELDYFEAGAQLRLGERERCLALLERYVARDPSASAYLARDPTFRSIWSDPRYARITRPAP
jgi:serine/threonine-protein kinase